MEYAGKALITEKEFEILKNRAEKHAKESKPLQQLMSEEEMGAVWKSFSKITANPHTTAAAVYKELFTIDPKLQDLFPFRTLTWKQVKRHEFFKGHAARFTHAIGLVVYAMMEGNYWGNRTGYYDVLLKLSEDHSAIPNFRKEYFDSFETAFLKVIQKNMHTVHKKERKALLVGWCLLLGVITTKMKQTFDEGNEQRVSAVPKANIVADPEETKTA